jgi:hypothetical protein
VTDVSPLPYGPTEALVGSREASARIDAPIDRIFTGGGGALIWRALSEALFWIAALDDQGRALPGYDARRDGEDGGRTVGGLVYARNRHAHNLVTAGEAEFIVPAPTVIQMPPGEPAAASSGRGTVFAMRARWVPLVALPPPDRPERHGRDAMYDGHVAGRPLREPLDEAAAWLDTVFPR